MSYYILPKYTSNKINIFAKWTDEQTTIEITNSPSLIYYLNNLLLQLSNPTLLSTFAKNNKSINSYKCLYSKIPVYNLSISKLNVSKHVYIYIELFNICNLLDFFNMNDKMHITSCNEHIIEYIFSLREKEKCEFTSVEDQHLVAADIINIEVDAFSTFNIYIQSLLKCVCYILSNQNNGGIAIIKIGHMFYKPVLDILFILNMLYDQVYIIKPQVSNIIHNELYIVCKHFIGLDTNSSYLLEQLNGITPFCISNAQSASPSSLKSAPSEVGVLNEKMCKEIPGNISSIIDGELPSFFLNKIEEANIIIYHQKIQHIDYIMNYKLNNNVQKYNIQKCVQWCEKYKVPHNKITDKLNIFLIPAASLDEISDEDKELEEIDIIVNPEPVDISSFSKQIELLNLFNIYF